MSQFSLVHAGLNSSLAPLPNSLGFGSETNSFSLGTTLVMEGVMIDASQVAVDDKARVVVIEKAKIRAILKDGGRERERRNLFEIAERILGLELKDNLPSVNKYVEARLLFSG